MVGINKYFLSIIFTLFMVALVVGCIPQPPAPSVPYPPSTNSDATPPFLRLGSAGLKKDILLTEASTTSESRHPKRTDEIWFRATANDTETGIKTVTLDMTLKVICGSTATNRTFSETEYAPLNTGRLPIELSKSYLFKVAPTRHQCQDIPSFSTLSIVASAENGLGQITQLFPAFISSFGPDRLRVATFNVDGPMNASDDTFRRWGQQLGAQSDVLILTEASDHRKIDLLTNAAGMSYMANMSNGDVVIASRNEIYDIQSNLIDGPGRLESNNSKILSVKSDIDGYPLQFIGTHWGIRDNDIAVGAESSSSTRLLAAQTIVGMVSSPSVPAFVAGDMNAYSGIGPQDQDGDPTTPDFIGSTSEIDFLRTKFFDSFITLSVPNTSHCSNQRIDYIMATGSFVPIKYEACFSDSSPSDHPFVLVTFEAGDQ